MARGQQKRRLPVLGATPGLAQTPEKVTKSRKLSVSSSPVCLLEEKSPHVLKLESAATALRPAAPKGGLLPCRSGERRKIATHLHTGVQQGGSTQVLYISGMPGTGKTAIVMEVLEQLKNQCAFHLVHINAMRLGSPIQVFREIADQMQWGTNNSNACSVATEMFNQRKVEDPVIVLLIDEVDCLVTPTQAVLYKVFDWLGMPNARLVLAAISNTMDLPERLLPRVASRFHIERVDFSPYNKSQLYEILCSRLKGQGALDAFGDVVLRLCAARVAAATGDIRKALQVCRRAVETRLQTAGREGPVNIADLEASERELILANPIAQAITALTTQAHRFLAAVVIELKRKEVDAVLLRKVTSRFQKILAIVAVDCERGCTEGTAADCGGTAADVAETAELLMQRLVSMGVLSKRASSSEFASSEPTFSLGSLDVEDLTSTLLKAEEDPLVRELLEGGRPGSQAISVFRPID